MKSIVMPLLIGSAIGMASNEPWVLALAVFGFIAGVAYADIRIGDHYVDQSRARIALERKAWIVYFDGLVRDRGEFDWAMLRHMVSVHGWDMDEWRRCLDAQDAAVVDQLDGETEGDMR